MRVLKIFSVLLLTGLSAAATGQVAPGGGPGEFAPGFNGTPKAPVQEAQDTPSALESQVMKDFKGGPISLDDMLGYLTEIVPGFNSVVIRPPFIPKDYPTLPALRLKNVTFGQFLELLRTSYPNLAINRIDGKGPNAVPLYVFRIEAYEPGMPGSTGMPPSTAQAEGAANDKPVVKVYRLNEILAHLNGATDPKKSMDDVLSLAQAALDETGDGRKDTTVLKVHQQTQTLLFKGSAEKMVVLEQALDALRPKESEQVAKVQADFDRMKQEYQNQAEQRDQQRQELRHFEAVTQALQEELMATKLELTQAQAQLKLATPPTTRP